MTTDSPLLNDVTSTIRKFLCKLHGMTDDHNYEPMTHVLYTCSETNNNVRQISEQETVNLIWVMLEELRDILDSSKVFPKRVKHWMDSVRSTRDEGVQTDLSNELTDNKFVQVTCSNDEFNRRINAFIKRKRAQADAFNRREFCKLQESNEDFSCARTDAVFVPRQSKKSLVRIEQVYNTAIRKDKSPLKMDRLKSWPPTHPSNTLPFSHAPHDIKERIQNLQAILIPNKRLGEFSDVYTQLRDLEHKLLYLEALSPEYFEMNNKPRMSVKRTAHGDTLTDGVTFDSGEVSSIKQGNIYLLEHRIEELKSRLGEKAKKLRTE